jgi:predicted dehydrogenase
MFMHSQRLPLLRHALEDGKAFGKLRRIDTNFCFHADDNFLKSNIRTNFDLEPLGCLGDLGWYCIRLILWSLNWQLPLNVSGLILQSTTTIADPHGVPLEFRGELQFQSNVTAGFYCSFVTAPQQWFVMSGTRQTIQSNDFVLPLAGNEVGFDICGDEYTMNGCAFVMRQHCQRQAVSEDAAGSRNSQEAQMFERFADLVCSGERDWHWSETSLVTQQVMDAALFSARQSGQPITLA